MRKIRNIATYIECSRRVGNCNILLFLLFASLSFFNFVTIQILKYYDFSLEIIGKPLIRYYYSPFLFLRIQDPMLKEYFFKKISIVYTISLFLLLGILFLLGSKKEGLLASGRFSTMREIYEKGFLCIGNSLKDGLILGRIPFQYSFRSFLFLLNFPLLAVNAFFVLTPNPNVLYSTFFISLLLGFLFLSISEKKMTIVENTEVHTSLVAQTRSGKGVGVIIPTSLNWRESLLAFDLKKEIYNESHVFREKKLNNKILLFEPYSGDYSDIHKIRYNPLSEIKIGTEQEVDDVSVIAEILTAPERAENVKEGSHWIKSAKDLIEGTILHLCYKERLVGKVPTLGEVFDFLTSGDVLSEIARTIDFYHESPSFFRKIYDESQMVGIPEGVHPLVYRWAVAITSKREDEFKDVLSTALNSLSMFKSPSVREATKYSDFKMKDLANGSQPYSLYLAIPEEKIGIGGILIRLITTLFVSKLTPKDFIHGNNKYRTLAILDELPLFNYIPAIERGTGYVAGAKIKLLVVGQSLSQFQKIYGKENILLDNMSNSVFYSSTSTDFDTASKVSKLLGSKTIEYRNFSMGQHTLQQRWSSTTTKRELMTPDEIINMDETRNLIMLRGDLRTIYGKKIVYYKEKYFLKKTKLI